MAYITVENATLYFDTRLNSDVWYATPDATSTSPDRKIQALETATNIIDRLAFRGSKTVSTQANQFPRNGNTEVPDAVQLATAEIALALLEGVDPDMEYEQLGMTSQAYANVRSSYDRTELPDHIVAGVPSIVAWRYLTPYLITDRNISLFRVS